MKNLHTKEKLSIYDLEENKRKKFLLSVILIGTIAFLVYFFGIVLHYRIQQAIKTYGTTLWILTILIPIFIGLFTLARKGLLTIPIYTTIFLYLTSTWYASYIWGMSMPIGLLIYTLVIIISGILVSSEFALYITIAIIIVLVFLGFREMQLPELVLWKQRQLAIEDIFIDSAILFAATLLSWLSNKETYKSLKRALKSEKALQEERDNLEIKIEQRTKEIKDIQIKELSKVEKMTELGKLSAGIFHDLMNPLSSVALYVKELEKTSSPFALEAKHYIDKAIHASKKMEKFMDSVRKQMNHSDTLEIFPILPEIQQACDLFAHKARTKDVTIEIKDETQTEIPTTLFGNPIRFHQIITNLISNSLEAYSTTDDENDSSIKKIVIMLSEKNEYAYILVKDSGCGIPKDIQEKIFIPFFTTKGGKEGLGIGLSTVKYIIEQDFKGIIELISTKQETIFSLRIPFQGNLKSD